MAITPTYWTPYTMTHMEDEKAEDGYFRDVVSFKFASLGTQPVTFKAINRVSEQTEVLSVAVTRGPCFSPTVLLSSQNPCEPHCGGPNNNIKVILICYIIILVDRFDLTPVLVEWIYGVIVSLWYNDTKYSPLEITGSVSNCLHGNTLSSILYL